jgi:hypothetical protein
MDYLLVFVLNNKYLAYKNLNLKINLNLKSKQERELLQ